MTPEATGLKVSSQETHLLSCTLQLCSQRLCSHKHKPTNTIPHPRRKDLELHANSSYFSVMTNSLNKKSKWTGSMGLSVMYPKGFSPELQRPLLFGLGPEWAGAWSISVEWCGRPNRGLWVPGIYYIRGDWGASLPFETWHHSKIPTPTVLALYSVNWQDVLKVMRTLWAELAKLWSFWSWIAIILHKSNFLIHYSMK